MDLISRADAIEAVCGDCCWYNTASCDGEEWECDSVNKIRNFPSAEPEKIFCSPDAEWIPCSERLPEEDGQYLVFYKGTIIGSCIDIMWYGEALMPNVDVSGKHFYRSDSEWGDIIYDEIIAWMPLPEPYREDGEA